MQGGTVHSVALLPFVIFAHPLRGESDEKEGGLAAPRLVCPLLCEKSVQIFNEDERLFRGIARQRSHRPV